KAEQSGRTMTNAKNLLVIADQKITSAQSAIDTLANLSATSTIATSTQATSTASTTTEVDLGKPRVIGSAAIRAVKDAQRALKDVVVAIAHSMGLKLGGDDNDHESSSTNST